MLQNADAQTKRKPIKAKPRPDLDRTELRAAISKRHAASLDYLGR